ncbi:MAG: D-alanyl-D-alanine carboxypeptidase/D-alanyl-D-alanine-endopeptidase [Bacteroidota bacterium]|jgi:D-alanyl-D-alanine carboxypeptidase/D-alanyl-D-alanine-endopeptidase (penicillin-binding protein 4)
MKILRLLILFYFLTSLQALTAQNAVQNAINSFSNSPEFINAGISFQAIDLSNGSVIAAFNPNLSLASASTAKLFSTASAIEILGAEYRPETRLYIEGTIEKDGTLKGSIWIRGGGDMTLGSKYFHSEEHQKDFLVSWADTIKKLGIKSITGSIYGDGSEFGYLGVPDGWNWSDMGNYYGAGPSGICVFDNMLKIVFKTGSYVGAKTELMSTFPTVENLVFHNYITSENVSGDHSYIFGGPFSLDRFSNGSLPLNQASFEVKGSLPDPEYQLADELTKQLKAIGVIVQEGAKSVRQQNLINKNRYQANYKLVYIHKGQKIADVATLTNMKSINLFAEQLVCLVGYKVNGNGSTEEGLKQIEKYWADKFSLNGLNLTDGSGLSRSNGISAVHFCSLLKAMSQSKNHSIYFSTLPIAGKSGTISGLCKDQPGSGRIVAKSGTMSRIKSYAGYINSKSGKKIAFALTVSNFNSTSNATVEKMERVLNALAVY